MCTACALTCARARPAAAGGGDDEATKAALELCREAGITKILTDTVEQQETLHLNPSPFK